MNNEHFLIQRIRKLTKILMLSGALNILLIGGFGYWIMNERPPTPYYQLKPAEKSQEEPIAMEHTNSQVIGAFKTLPYEQLKARLANTQLVENGYTQRDLALACLVSYYHFDLAKALAKNSEPLQKRVLLYGTDKIVVYPGLTDKQFQSVIAFSQTEKWPLTAPGLFAALKKQAMPPDQALMDAFVLSPEFLAVELLFNRSEVPVDKLELISVLRDGDWTMLSSFTEKQKISQDLSPSRRERFLLDYIKRKSKAAAYVLLKTDGDFAAKKLDDATVIQMLELLTIRTPLAEKFAITVLSSPRSDGVWKKASSRLYEYLGESQPERFDPQAILSRFVPQMKWQTPVKNTLPTKPIAEAPKPQPITKDVAPIAKNSQPMSIKKEKLYVVQEGDSFWKIAKRFKIDINALKSYNNIQSDFIKPGMTLKIP